MNEGIPTEIFKEKHKGMHARTLVAIRERISGGLPDFFFKEIHSKIFGETFAEINLKKPARFIFSLTKFGRKFVISKKNPQRSF